MKAIPAFSKSQYRFHRLSNAPHHFLTSVYQERPGCSLHFPGVFFLEHHNARLTFRSCHLGMRGVLITPHPHLRLRHHPTVHTEHSAEFLTSTQLTAMSFSRSICLTQDQIAKMHKLTQQVTTECCHEPREILVTTSLIILHCATAFRMKFVLTKRKRIIQLSKATISALR